MGDLIGSDGLEWGGYLDNSSFGELRGDHGFRLNREDSIAAE